MKVNESNASTSCADSVLVEDWDEEDENVSSSSNTNILSHVVLNSNANISTVAKYKPKKFVRQSDKCACTCGNSGKQKQIPKRDPQTSQRPRPSPNHIVLKRQTCFNCGTPGHIARNCPHRPYIPYYAQNWQNVPRRKSSKRRNSSRSCSSDGDWNADKAKNQTSRAKTWTFQDKKVDSKVAFTKPK